MLLVEDSESDALLLLRELRRGGYEPIYERVETPEEMGEALANSEWDVIISDYRMPRFSAPEALQMARRAKPGVPFVVVSGKVGEEAAVEAMRAGAHDYVMKGNLARLCATVERGLEEAEERRGRKRVEEELRDSEAEMRALFEAMTDIIFVVDGEGRYVKIAPTNPSLLYRPPDELLGKTVHEVFAPEQADEFLGHIRLALETQRRVNFEYDLQIGQQKMWFDCSISPMLEDSVVVVVRDITERKRSEEALRVSEALYRAVIEQATENIFLVDVETLRIVESNPAFRSTLGYSEGELKRMTLHDIVAADPESVDENLRRVLELKNPFVGERKYRRKDGSLIDVEVSASVIVLDGKETLCAVAHDITERARAQELLVERVDTLRRAHEP